MDLKEESFFGQVRHPWEEARFELFARILAERSVLETSRLVLDVGSGDGWFASRLREQARPDVEICCLDMHYGADPPVPRPGIRFTAEAPAMRADLVLMMDVLEHVDDDRAMLRRIIEGNTHPGSYLLVTVPAYQALFSSHDRYLEHYRRYAPARGRRLVTSAGLEILEQGGAFHSLLLPRALSVVAESAGSILGRTAEPGASSRWDRGAGVTAAVRSALRLDNRLSLAARRAGVTVPGLTWWALCRRP